MMKNRFPWRDEEIWITPGGGIESGETAREAAVREVREETGFVVDELGPELWTRDHLIDLPSGKTLLRERYFLVQTEEFEPSSDALEDGFEKDWFRGYRWWSAAQLLETRAQIAPGRLAQLISELLRDGPPLKPFSISA